MNKIAVFVDVQNIYYTTKQVYARQFDYRKLWQKLELDGEIVLANAYAIERNDDGQKRFQSALRSIGFTVKLKPYIQRSDGSSKGDWDIGIALDIIDIAKQVDKIVLLSGDGDFSLLIDKIKQDPKLATQVYGVQALTAKALIDAADDYICIDESLLL